MKDHLSDLKKKEVKRERIELGDGKMCDLVGYEVEGYGYVEFTENIGVSNGEFRRSRSMMPFSYLDAKCADFKWDIYGVNTDMAKKVANSIIINFDKYQKEGKSLYIYSKTKGSGKTFLACCLANEIMNRHDICVKFISIPDLLEMTKRSFKDFTEKEDLNKIRTAELLILDDIGAETKKEWIDTELFRLIDFRYTSKRVTIFTSNIEIDHLKLNDRIIDRIFSMCVKLNLPEKSIRAMHADRENKEFISEILKGAE